MSKKQSQLGANDIVSQPTDGASAWVETTEYQAGEWVSYNDTQYVCKKDAPAGTLPTNVTYWTEMMESKKKFSTENATLSKTIDDKVAVKSFTTSGDGNVVSNISLDTDTGAMTATKSTVVTCLPFPEGTQTGVGTSSGVRTVDFCNSLANNPSVVTGMMYLGDVYLTEGVNSPTVPDAGHILAAGSEVTVKVLKCTRSTNYVNIVMVLEMTSTNQGPRHWMTVYEKYGSTTDPSKVGQLMFGSESLPWFGMLFSPLDDSTTTNPLVDQFIAASKKDVKVKDFEVTGTGNAVTGMSINDNGKLIVTLGQVGGAEEAKFDPKGEDEVGNNGNTPTVSNKMITPKNAPYAVTWGLIHAANGTTAAKHDLKDPEKRAIQSWLGVNELTFVIDNGDSTTSTRTFKFVSMENELPT